MKKKILIAFIIVMAFTSIGLGRQLAIDYFRHQAVLAEQRGNYTGAIDNFNKVFFLSFNSKTAGMYAYRARLYFNNGDINNALTDLKTALSIDKNNPDAHLGVGLIRLQEGDTKEAIKEFTAVINIRPKWVEAYMSRQVAYRKLGEKKKARRDLASVLEVDPKNAWAKKALKMLEQ